MPDCASGAPAESLYRPTVVVHNAGATETTLNGRVPYTTIGGNQGQIILPQVQLSPGETEVIDIAPLVNAHGLTDDVTAAGLEFQYTGELGSVITSAFSVSRSGNQVLRVPLWDIAAQRSGTGGYPWYIEGDSSTVIYIKNVADETQNYRMYLKLTGEDYVFPLTTVAPHQTTVIDVRKLRDTQVPDVNGQTIPAGETRGQVQWSLTGGVDRVLIGRSEQVDLVRGISSNYACQNCCPNNFYDGWLTPAQSTAFEGDQFQFIAMQQDMNCYGQVYPAYQAGFPSFTSSDLSICNPDWTTGTTTGVAPGEAIINGVWTGDAWLSSPTGVCDYDPIEVLRDAICNILCSKPTGESTASDGWSTLDPTLHSFKQTLTPGETSFVGRTVTEQDPGNGGPDTCHFPNSDWDPFDKVDGSTWTVTNGNQWKPDQVGYFPGVVAYYRNRGRAPCGTKFKQRMVINCATGPITYITNDLEASITATTVTSKRAGVSESRNYP